MEKLGKEDFIEFSIIDRRFLVSEERPFERPKDSHLTTNVIRCSLWSIGLILFRWLILILRWFTLTVSF